MDGTVKLKALILPEANSKKKRKKAASANKFEYVIVAKKSTTRCARFALLTPLCSATLL